MSEQGDVSSSGADLDMNETEHSLRLHGALRLLSAAPAETLLAGHKDAAHCQQLEEQTLVGAAALIGPQRAEIWRPNQQTRPTRWRSRSRLWGQYIWIVDARGSREIYRRGPRASDPYI